MQPLPFILLCLALPATSMQANLTSRNFGIRVNYLSVFPTVIYSLGISLVLANPLPESYDGGCTDYASSPPNVPTDNSCYNWNWGGSNSANIGQCGDDALCECAFFAKDGCQGSSKKASDGDSCASD